MPAAILNSRPIVQFRALNSAGKVDAKTGVIYGVSVITQGPALGHNVTVDETGLQQCLAACQELGDEGVKLVINHDSGFQEIVGTVKNFRASGLQLIGDAHLLDTPADRAHILELAQKLPRNIGLSVETYGEAEKIDGKKYFRVTSIDAIALVPNPAANPKGLFSRQTAKTKLAEISTEDLREQITQAANDDERFNQPDDSNQLCCGPWVSDVLNNGGQWSAVIQGADNHYYEVAITLSGTQVVLGESKEVIRSVEYKPVDSQQMSKRSDNPQDMTDTELKSAISEAVKPFAAEVEALKTKLNERDSEEQKTKLAAKQVEDQAALEKLISEKVEAGVKEQGKQIAADAVTKFAASIGVKTAPEGSGEGDKGAPTFEVRVATHLSALPANKKDRGLAIQRAANDDPEGYNKWCANGGK